jgi:hypothetical protein
MNGKKENSLWRNVLRHPKLTILAFASPFFIHIAWRNLDTVLSEQRPTPFQAERFSDDYRGQRWLHVEGRLAAEYADVKVNYQNKEFSHVHVPLVPLDWEPDQVVHVVGTFSMRNSEVDRWIEKTLRSPQHTLTGMVGPLGPMRYGDMFPKLRFEEPVVYINDGGTPGDPTFNFLFLGFTIVLLVGSWWWLAALLLSWWRRRQAAAVERENAERAMWS